ncbi:MAG: zinc-dependent metalloprotease [Gammaproteobacteria bacterium]|nr:zinc-dependent metalloprotease [Gammaproteobacteria bacterium]
MDAKTTRRRQLYRYIQLLALFAVFVGTSTASWAETRYMFDTDSLTADIARLDADSVQLSNIDRLTSQPATKGFEAARLSKDFIQSMNKNDSINVNIFGRYIPMTIKDYQDREDGSIVHASNPDTGAHMMLYIQGNNLTGSIRDGGDLYNLQSLGNNIVGITLVDESQLQEHSTNYPTGAMEPSEGKPIQLQKNNSSNSFNSSLADSAGTIRVMVVYTPAASAAVTNINSTIALAIAETNQSYANSGVNTRLELAHSYQTAYTETGSMPIDLERIRTSSDGHMDEVHSLRNTHAADIVILMGSNNYSYCGLASTIMATEASAFAIVRISCATGYYSFGHEVGHLQGARHIISHDSSIVPFAYGHGYCQPGVSNGWRTVMAYHCPNGDGPRIPYWSNPHKLYSGEAMGVVGTSNNARVLNETLVF